MINTTVICETFNQSRYLPHEKISQNLKYIKVNALKKSPLYIFSILINIVLTFINDNYVFVAPLLLSPLIIFYLPLKWVKPNKVILDTSHIGWDKNEYPVELGLFKPVLKYLWFLFIKNVKVRAINRSAYEFLSDYSNKVAFIPHSVDTTIFKPIINVPKNDKYTVLFVGKVMYKKGIDLIIKAAQSLTDVQFWIVGKGPYQQKIKEFNLPNIKFMGFKADRKELNLTYNQCHCLLLPSRKYKGWEELFGIVIIEAMATTLPVIAADCVGPTGIIKHKLDGLLFEKENTNQMMEAIKKLQDDKVLRKRITKNAEIKVRNYYSLDVVSDQLRKLVMS